MTTRLSVKISLVEALADLKRTVTELLKELRESVFNTPSEFMDLLIVEVYFDQLSEEDIMARMIENIVPHAATIERRDAQFFADNPVIFAGIPSGSIKKYQNFWTEGRLSEEDETALWAYFDAILEIAQGYLDLKKRAG